MTTHQRIALMAEWWPAAAKAQGWNPKDRAKRIEVMSQILGRSIASASEINNTDELGRVKNHLLKLADNIAATIETDHPEMDNARRKRFLIRERVKCLGVYVDNAEALLAELIRDKFQRGARSLLRPLSIYDLTDDVRSARGFEKQSRSDLDQILWALSRVLSKHRQDAGDTEHDMHMKAGVRCHCTHCLRYGQPAPTLTRETVPELATVANVSEPDPF